MRDVPDTALHLLKLDQLQDILSEVLAGVMTVHYRYRILDAGSDYAGEQAKCNVRLRMADTLPLDFQLTDKSCGVLTYEAVVSFIRPEAIRAINKAIEAVNNREMG